MKVSECCKMYHRYSAAILAAPASHMETCLADNHLLAAASRLDSLDLAAGSCHMHPPDSSLAATRNYCFGAAASGMHLVAVAAHTYPAADMSVAATDRNSVAADAESAVVVAIHCQLAATGTCLAEVHNCCPAAIDKHLAVAFALSNHLALPGRLV